MITIRLSDNSWFKKIKMAVSTGKALMIESIEEEIDPILDPLLSQKFVKMGKS